jgi:hypothetical protein
VTDFRRRTIRGGAIALAAILGLTSSGAAQAVLMGRAVNDSTGDPITGVEVVIEKLNLNTASDRDGRFTLGNLSWGIRHATLRKIGYRPVKLQLFIASDDTLRADIRMRPSVVELPPIEVTASSVPVGMEDFARRRLAGFGKFIDSKELRRADHRRVSDLLVGVRGIRPITLGFRTVLVSSRSNCPMAVWLDGIQLFAPGSRRPAPDIDAFAAHQLEGIEVYSGPAETPPELSGFGSGCGAIALWSRRT